MENRILVIGDEIFGQNGEAANRFAEVLLCREPNRPVQFSINAPAPQSMSQLKVRMSSDIIGKKAGQIVLGLGFGELKRGTVDAELSELYCALLCELSCKTLAKIYVLTIPMDMLPEGRGHVLVLNEAIRRLCGDSESRLCLLDFAAEVEKFKEKQSERGKFGRSLYTEQGMPTPLCHMLLALFLQENLKSFIDKRGEI